MEIKVGCSFEVMADRSTTKVGKGSKRIGRSKKVEVEKQVKLALEVGYSGRKVTLA